MSGCTGTQLLYVAALLFSQARSSDKAKVKDDLMELGRCMEKAGCLKAVRTEFRALIILDSFGTNQIVWEI